MRLFFGGRPGAGIFNSDGGKSPWGNRPHGSGGDGNGGDKSGEKGGGPRNPWTMPPGIRRPRPGATSLEDFLKRTRGGGGGSGGGGGGFGGFELPGGPTLWLAGLAVLVALWLIGTSYHSIAPRERGVVTVLGRYSGTLQPGLNWTAPWPIAAVKVVNVGGVRTENFPDGGAENLVLTSDQNIVDLAYSVFWRVKNAQNYEFQIDDPDGTVRATAESAMRASIANVTLDDAIGKGRERIEADAQQRMQAMLDSYQSGVEVVSVALKPANPPRAVDDAFKAVTAAQQQAQGNLNQARAYAQQVIARAQGDAVQFDKIYAQYKLAPEVTRRRLYYETMEEVLVRSNKTIVEPRGAAPYVPIPALKGRQNSPPPADDPKAADAPAGGPQ